MILVCTDYTENILFLKLDCLGDKLEISFHSGLQNFLLIYSGTHVEQTEGFGNDEKKKRKSQPAMGLRTETTSCDRESLCNLYWSVV